jgi:fructose-1-phosphate kinase PfkB-like protein
MTSTERSLPCRDKLGARLVLDTSGEALRQGTEAGVYLLKPNLRELGQLVGAELDDETSQERSAWELVDRGQSEVVVVSLGAAGVLLVSADKVSGLLHAGYCNEAAGDDRACWAASIARPAYAPR